MTNQPVVVAIDASSLSAAMACLDALVEAIVEAQALTFADQCRAEGFSEAETRRLTGQFRVCCHQPEMVARLLAAFVFVATEAVGTVH
jgi:hypothetical protein